MCEYMEYTIKATVLFCGTYKGLFGKTKEFSRHGNIVLSAIAISEDEVVQVLIDKTDKMCETLVQRGEFNFHLDDDFYCKDLWYDIVPRLKTVNGSIVDFIVSVDDPRKWTIQKVIKKCSVEEAVAIFGDRIGWLLGLIKNVEE